jgi:hypothetical protein
VIPTAAQADVAKNRPLQTGDELEFYSLHGHDAFSFLKCSLVNSLFVEG